MRSFAALLVLTIGGILLLSYTFHKTESKFNVFGDLAKQFRGSWVATVTDVNNKIKDIILHPFEIERAKKDKEIERILRKLDQMIPNVSFTNISTTTSAKTSQASIVNLKDSYCVGDHLRVRLDLYDHLGKRKVYGGDFLRARIYSSKLNAGASGFIQDFKNGTYLVDFTLFWEGTISISFLLIHPSEAVSALWAARKKGYDKIDFVGKFLNGSLAVNTQCGFNLTQNLDLCTYLDERDQEAFYCVKPKNVPCDAFVSLKSFNHPNSYLTALEKTLFSRANLGVEIPHMLGEIPVVSCENTTGVSEKCTFEVNATFPSGFMWQNQWLLLSCDMHPFTTLGEIATCLKGKMVYIMGDSTGRQWIEYLTRRMKTLQYLDIHGTGRHPNLIAVDLSQKIQIQWKKHHHPLVTVSEYMVRDHNYIAREIDNVAGDKDTAIVIAIGQHFRPFPIELFLRRAINVRSAIQRLLLRSPKTKVIIKGENLREMTSDQERFSNFHGYVQYLVAKEIFRDLNAAFIDAWDMTIAYGTDSIHPPDHVVWNEIKMFLNYLC